LLADIESGLVDIVVVYKVDRLTRSLSDFAKIIEVFDRQGASFVAVTQQFNTTSSMGRLTLNILLSFAQFEREVTGERIRDKIAASKRKGMWMGGFVPLGYDVQDRKLVINKKEAEQVRYIFRRYNELDSVRELKRDLDEKGFHSKPRITPNGKRYGGVPIAKGNLYEILRNPVYIGEIRHKQQNHPGQHEPIIARDLWEETQARLDRNRQGHKQRGASRNVSPLRGKLFDEDGERLTPTFAYTRGSKYRYYCSQFLTGGKDQSRKGWRLPAQEIEDAVSASLKQFLSDQSRWIDAWKQNGLPFDQFGAVADAIKIDALGSVPKQTEFDMIDRVEISPKGLTLHVTFEPLSVPGIVLTFFAPMVMKRRGVGMRLIVGENALPKVDPVLLKAVAKAHNWFAEIASGSIASGADIARREGVTRHYVNELLPLAFLDPKIVKAIIDGRQPVELTAEVLTRHTEISMRWDEQKKQLGFPVIAN
jgi:DNA invertase Pin-like site-specific DNA recombinase